MSPELRRLIEREREMLRRLVAEHRETIEAALRHEPGLIEREAIAMMLHSFYTGIESIMRSIAGASGRFAKSEGWHAELLKSMQEKTEDRPALLTPELAATLSGYLTFRHRFRNLYGFELEWRRMKTLVERVEEALAEFEAALDRFIEQVQ